MSETRRPIERRKTVQGESVSPDTIKELKEVVDQLVQIEGAAQWKDSMPAKLDVLTLALEELKFHLGIESATVGFEDYLGLQFLVDEGKIWCAKGEKGTIWPGRGKKA